MTKPSLYIPNLDVLGWQAADKVMSGWPGAAPSIGAQVKLVNRDPDTGAFVAMGKLPPGAHDPALGVHSCHEELFLVRGDLSVNRQTLSGPAYWYIPAGTVHGDIRTSSGAVVIMAFTGPWNFTATTMGRSDGPALQSVDVGSMEWKATSEVTDHYHYVGPRSKMLRVDPKTKAHTEIVQIPANYHHPDLSYHQHTQEQFLLEGMVNETAIERRAPAYWCHPPNEVHGKSFTGQSTAVSLLFFDGPWEVTIVEDPRAGKR
jgi:hypothetical protein